MNGIIDALPPAAAPHAVVAVHIFPGLDCVVLSLCCVKAHVMSDTRPSLAGWWWGDTALKKKKNTIGEEVAHTSGMPSGRSEK